MCSSPSIRQNTSWLVDYKDVRALDKSGRYNVLTGELRLESRLFITDIVARSALWASVASWWALLLSWSARSSCRTRRWSSLFRLASRSERSMMRWMPSDLWQVSQWVSGSATEAEVTKYTIGRTSGSSDYWGSWTSWEMVGRSLRNINVHPQSPYMRGLNRRFTRWWFYLTESSTPAMRRTHTCGTSSYANSLLDSYRVRPRRTMQWCLQLENTVRVIPLDAIPKGMSIAFTSSPLGWSGRPRMGRLSIQFMSTPFAHLMVGWSKYETSPPVHYSLSRSIQDLSHHHYFFMHLSCYKERNISIALTTAGSLKQHTSFKLTSFLLFEVDTFDTIGTHMSVTAFLCPRTHLSYKIMDSDWLSAIELDFPKQTLLPWFNNGHGPLFAFFLISS